MSVELLLGDADSKWPARLEVGRLDQFVIVGREHRRRGQVFSGLDCWRVTG